MNFDKGLLILLFRLFYISSCYGQIENIESDLCASKNPSSKDDGREFRALKRNDTTTGEICPNLRSSDILLTRKKRALAFPTGSNFVITLSLVKALLIGLPLGWNIAMEIDVPFKMVGFQDLFRRKIHRLHIHRRHRRELWKGIGAVLNANGINGEACILRAMCEVQYFLAPKDTIFVHDILRVLLSVPKEDPVDKYKKATETVDCNVYNGEKKCPISILQLLSSYGRVI